jgi:YD repeat-containing protein
MEIVTLTMSVFIGNLKPLAGQNENCCRQRQGGGGAFFEYDDIVQQFEFNYNDAEQPAHQTTLTERNGHPVHYIYNKFGNLILREENILQEGLIRLLQWRYRYNADGALVGVLTPDGVVTQYYYGRDDYLRRNGITDEEVRTHDQLTAAARMAFGNLLAAVKRGRRYDLATMDLSRGVWGDFFPDILGATEASDIITKFTFESDFQQMLTSSDPRFTQSADPAAIAPPFETQRYQETLTRYEYTGPAGNPHLLLARVRYPDTHLPDGTTLTNIVQEYPAYDAKGRLVSSIDPEGIVIELGYFDATHGVKEGYLQRRTIDPGGLAITTRYEVNEVGIPTTIIQPRAAGVTDGRFRTRVDVDALNQVTRTVTSPPLLL